MVKIIQELDGALEQYKFYEAADKIYHFIWHEFCDWYIELVKPSLREGNKTSMSVLLDTLDQILKMLHPFMPFLTEEIWQQLGHDQSILLAPWPRYQEEALVKDEVTIVAQVNGKLRSRLTVPLDTDEEIIKKMAMEDERVLKFIDGKTIRKVIVVSNKLVNIVV